jgi:hypothetical protein
MPAVKDKKVVSFETSRKALRVGLVAQAKGKETEKIIPFANNDVPDFLRKLNEFEGRSRHTCLMVK